MTKAHKTLLDLRIKAIKILNKHMTKSLPFVDLNLNSYDDIIEDYKDIDFLSSKFLKSANYLFQATKDK